MSKKAAFVTIGQTPRLDMVPEMTAEILAGLPDGVMEVHEFGVLDGKSDEELLDFLARPEGQTFATRLASGEEVVVDVLAIERELNRLLATLDGAYDLIVLLCTSTHIDPLSKSLVIEAQKLVDSTFEALGASAQRLGVLCRSNAKLQSFRAVIPLVAVSLMLPPRLTKGMLLLRRPTRSRLAISL